METTTPGHGPRLRTMSVQRGPVRRWVKESSERTTAAAARLSGGTVADRSGGLITFEAESDAAAEALVANDPFLREHLLERHWVKEWLLD
jgi:hypothetical protein